MPTIDEIIEDLAQKRGTQHVVDLANSEPGRLPLLVREAARQLARSSTAIDAALALVPEDELPDIADEAVSALSAGDVLVGGDRSH